MKRLFYYTLLFFAFLLLVVAAFFASIVFLTAKRLAVLCECRDFFFGLNVVSRFAI